MQPLDSRDQGPAPRRTAHSDCRSTAGHSWSHREYSNQGGCHTSTLFLVSVTNYGCAASHTSGPFESSQGIPKRSTFLGACRDRHIGRASRDRGKVAEHAVGKVVRPAAQRLVAIDDRAGAWFKDSSLPERKSSRPTTHVLAVTRAWHVAIGGICLPWRIIDQAALDSIVSMSMCEHWLYITYVALAGVFQSSKLIPTVVAKVQTRLHSHVLIIPPRVCRQRPRVDWIYPASLGLP
jgi:hypothetical protein